MNELLTQFITTNMGKPNLGDTPQNKGECVGLIELWLDLLKINDPHLWGDAIDLLKNADPTKFQVVYNKLGNTFQFPPDGAIPVLGKPFGLQADGTYKGHTGLSIGSTGQLLRLFQQNDPEGSTPSIKTYSYDACIGWLIPKVTLQGGDTVDQITINGQKAHLFDLIWLHRFPGINTNDVNETQVNIFNAWLDSNTHRAGAFDQICLALGLTGDSNQITGKQVLAKITDPTAAKKLEQIKTIVNE